MGRSWKRDFQYENSTKGVWRSVGRIGVRPEPARCVFCRNDVNSASSQAAHPCYGESIRKAKAIENVVPSSRTSVALVFEPYSKRSFFGLAGASYSSRKRVKVFVLGTRIARNISCMNHTASGINIRGR